MIRNIQVDDVTLTLARHELERCNRQVSVRIDEHEASLFVACHHEVVGDSQQKT